MMASDWSFDIIQQFYKLEQFVVELVYLHWPLEPAVQFYEMLYKQLRASFTLIIYFCSNIVYGAFNYQLVFENKQKTTQACHSKN